MPPAIRPARRENKKKKLPRKELLLRSVNVQSGFCRFPDKNIQPRLCAWRNNLTGLSQVHNLYFVACEDNIHIYQPLFPDQHIPEQGTVILHLPQTAKNLRGHLVPEKPHAVNNLVVGKLGSEEILLCACDDGDVLAFQTRKIERHVADFTACSQTSTSTKSQPRTLYLKPFMHVNVRMSAWGLAIHSKLRLIAVSCNTHVISTYAFALTDDFNNDHNSVLDLTANTSPGLEQTSSLSESSFYDDSGILQEEENGFFKPSAACLDLLTDRGRNCCFHLEGHYHNIPVITFCPHDEDDGRVTKLASSDICGTTIIWDVNTATQLRRLEPYHTPGSYLMSGWALLSIDPRCFHKKKTLVEAFKVCQAIKTSRSGRFLADISQGRYLVPDSGPWNISGDYSDSENLMSDVESDAGQSSQDHSSTALEEPEEFGFSDHAIVSPFTHNEVSGDSLDRILQANQQGILPVHVLPNRSCPIESRDMILPMIGLTRVLVEPENELAEPAQDVRWSPLLLAHPKVVQLFQSPKWNNFSTRAEEPVIFCGNPLQQMIDDGEISSMLSSYDRMNMAIQIPDLGVILIGSPKGRVAVFSLHQIEHAAFSAEHKPDPVYTIRLDYLLPFSSQEKERARPIPPLVGVAASPVQGMLGSVDKSRWRVLMLYLEHTVLSYEISRMHDEIDVISL